MIERALTATNAAKAVVLIVLNAAVNFAEAFGIYDFSDMQQKALEGAAYALSLVYVLATYKLSAKRAPD